MGLAFLPGIEDIKQQVRSAASRAWFLSLVALGREAGMPQSGNTSLLGALCASGLLPFGADALKESIKKYLHRKFVDTNLRAVDLGVAAMGQKAS